MSIEELKRISNPINRARVVVAKMFMEILLDKHGSSMRLHLYLGLIYDQKV